MVLGLPLGTSHARGPRTLKLQVGSTFAGTGEPKSMGRTNGRRQRYDEVESLQGRD